jgi:hypothetical protein
MMTSEEFDRFVDRARAELESKQESLTRSYGFGRYEKFWFDQLTGKLQLKDSSGRVEVEADVTPIGSFSENSGTWKWAWSNESIVDALRQRSERLKELHAITGMDVFAAPAFRADEQMAWDATAMAVSHLGCMGCYRMPSKHLEVFVAIERVSVPEKGVASEQ